jgi:hypothetical protein
MNDRSLRRLRDASIIGSLGGQALAWGLWAFIQIIGAAIILLIMLPIIVVMFYYMLGPIGVGLAVLFGLSVIYFMVRSRCRPEPRPTVTFEDETPEEEGPTVNLPPPGSV